MAIADLSRPGRTPKGPTCEVCRVLADLDPSEADALRGHLGNPAWRYQQLSDALASEAINLPAFSLARHARGQCAAKEKIR